MNITSFLCLGRRGSPDRDRLRGEQVPDLDSPEAGPTRDGPVQSGAAHFYPGAEEFSGQTLRLLLPRRLPVRVRPHVFCSVFDLKYCYNVRKSVNKV